MCCRWCLRSFGYLCCWSSIPWTHRLNEALWDGLQSAGKDRPPTDPQLWSPCVMWSRLKKLEYQFGTTDLNHIQYVNSKHQIPSKFKTSEPQACLSRQSNPVRSKAFSMPSYQDIFFLSCQRLSTGRLQSRFAQQTPSYQSTPRNL